MEYITLGKTSLKVSAIGLGAWQFGERGWGWGVTLDEKQALEIMNTAFDMGVNLIDTAETYGDGVSERVVGRAIRERREEVVVATKVSPTHLRYGSMLKAAERSLNRLGIREIDLYQIHFPNPLVPLRETMRAMEKLVEDGKIRHIGVSNFSARLLRKAQQTLAKHEIVSDQVKYNLLQRNVEAELLPYAKGTGVTILAYSPLAQGMLTGKFTAPTAEGARGFNSIFTSRSNFEKCTRVVEVVKKIAERHRRTPAQVALNWLIRDPTVLPIPGAKNIQQLNDNLGGVGWRMPQEDLATIDEACKTLKLNRSMNPLPAVRYMADRVYRKIVG